jgi:hypothetical protein
MSFNMWQKLMAASTENAVVVACCEVAAEDELKPGHLREATTNSLADAIRRR